MNIWQNSSIRQALNKKGFQLLLTVSVTAVLFFTALAVGSSGISISEVVKAIVNGDGEATALRIFMYIRLPRAAGALLAGSAFAVSGIILQSVLNNPMAAPNLIGVNAGAGFAAILTMAVFPGLIHLLPFSAFAGALLAAVVIYAISAVTDAGRITVTLVGIAVSSILTAGINAVKTLFPDSVYDVSGFLIGGLSSADTASVIPAGVLIVFSLAIAVVFSRTLDVLSLGDEMARGLGLNVKIVKLLWLVLAAILAGAAVSFSGLIGFVGLIVPHIMRRIFGNIHRWLIPVSIFGGGALLLGADTVARTLFSPYELPVGILLSLVGGPFFIFLILSERRGRR